MPTLISLSVTDLIVLSFLALVCIWMFVRPGQVIDRLLLVVAGLIYIAAMIATFRKVSPEGPRAIIVDVLLETVGFGLVLLSRQFRKSRHTSD